MKSFRVHLKGSNTPQIVHGYTAEYTKEYLIIRRNRRVAAQFLKSDTQGWYEELSEDERARFATPTPIKARKRGPRPELAPSHRKQDSLSIQ
jgi:hypothetical protein